MDLYAVYDQEGLFAVIKAQSKDKALDVFVVNQVNNEFFNEHISEFAVNAGLLEKFFKDDEGSLFDSFTGDYPSRIKHMEENEQRNYIDTWIEKNAKDFWDNKPQFASEYLNELNKSYNSDEDYVVEFSYEFKVDTFKRLIQKGDWYKGFDIVKIDLENNNFQLISQDL